MTTKTLDRCASPNKTTAPQTAPSECTPAECAPRGAADRSADRSTGRSDGPATRHRVVTPRADVWETADAAHLAIELPGVRPDDLDLRVENDRLTVRATSGEHDADGKELAAEWRPRTYERTFALTDDADREAIDAHLRHGLLLVTVPRRAERRPRSIPVRVAAD